MLKYSPVDIVFISLNILSLLLLTYLIIKLCISSNHFTKYTQLQLFITAWAYTIGFLPNIIKYGDDIINKAFDTRILCLIQQIIYLFFFYPLHILPIILGFYIWHAIENRNIKIERKYFWTFSIINWCFTICFNTYSFADAYTSENFGIRVTPLFCKPRNSNLQRITYLIIMLPIFFITLIFTFYFSTLLWKRWQQFSVKRNRWTALRLGHSIRLFICSIMYTIFLGVSLISRIVFQYIIKNPENGIEIEDFAQPFIGIILFLIFAKSDSPTILLPCIYYGNPEKLTFKSNSYCRDDSFLFARPPSLTASFRDYNPPSNTMQQMQHSQQMQLVQQMQQMQQMQQVTRSNNILHTTLLTIPEEKSPVDITNDDQDTIIEEIEVIV
ncbi:uncharacterized protein OCT59_028077 [Rhizophagus irregularis]|uniref:G-protein coupled receptors family 1 profile domain-containing protein n=3 Tax=Rhizophagus irregularis TaxID=588596 RepID=A0A2P4P764_RHIID|nr:hypothetical protein GLOIN_2v1705497 [Rhizophagus irregularis DAOM 181602=DAOM 197198]POG61224.1 hypothetical protein GLOIN_2v1705497 [Rhizophagus irregularis DAOM 181602=DAOM 197198]UZO07804.1 hypothetical protein OCT59_028077 [Rhizophagus irregularis]GBC43198.2 hypothetical protein GLOIN_2v1705497 [Rhizophagus irregularis DAOM 181602=DAOM 197198]|eukprot:XP_025168090.1 hypothetical protein GLOIN_2v1705497 [Rhizophagus irregularis DAOM 181602=DAOM 197198]